MSASFQQRLNSYTSITVDGWGVLLAALFTVVLLGSVLIASWVASLGVEPAMSGSSGGTQAAAGAGWVIAEVIAAVILLGVIVLYNRLPEYIQDIVKTAFIFTASMYIGVRADSLNVFWPIAITLSGYYAIIEITDEFDVYWLWNDLEAIVLAIVLAGALGSILPLPFLLVGIIGLTIYDHVFANQQDWMFTLGGGMLRAKLPVVVFAFPRLRVDWDDIVKAVKPDGDVDDESVTDLLTSSHGFGIGMADLLLPAAFAAAVVVNTGGVTAAVLGVAGGVVIAAFRLRWEMINLGGGAGLPAISTGVVGGYALGIIPMVIL